MKLRKSRHCIDYRSTFLNGRTDEISVNYDIPEITRIEFSNQKRLMVEHWKTEFRMYHDILPKSGYEIIGIPDEAP